PATPLNVETREPDLLADPETSSQPEAPEVAESVDPVDLPPQPTAPPPVPEPEPTPEPEPEPEPESQSEPEPEPAPAAEPEPQPEPVPAPEPAPIPIPQTIEPHEPSLDMLLTGGPDDTYEEAPPPRQRFRLGSAGIAWIIIGVLVIAGGAYVASDSERNQRLFGWLRGESDTVSMADADQAQPPAATGQPSADGTGQQTSQPSTQQTTAQTSTPTEGTAPAGQQPTADSGNQATTAGTESPQATGGQASTGTGETPSESAEQQQAPGADAQGEQPQNVEVVEEPVEEIVVVEEVVDEDEPLTDESLAPLPPGASLEMRLLVDAALRGDAPSQQELGSRYAEGVGVDQSYELAFYWFAQAAEQGVFDAIYNLGVMLDRGLGTPQDRERAFSLFLRAAEAGHPRAQLAVGLGYAQGNGVEADLTLATQWLQAASASGNPRGAFYMGRLFERGLDGAPDLAAAAGWYRIAADAGDVDAAEALERLNGTDGEGPLADVTSPENRVPLPETEPTPVAAGSAEPVDREGIREIQTLLAQLGFSPGSADGIMGNRTRSAIQAFQRLVGTPVTGEATTQVLENLREAASDS
ncbi:MAG: peptidoglycan-binding protein, partial [Pseudomonadota bacterium]